MSSRFFSTTIFLGLMAGIMMSSSHAAKIYHWVDESGQPHYSENPPRAIQSEALNVNATSKGSAGSSATSSTSEVATKSTETKDEDTSLTAEHSPEDKAKYCQQSRDLLVQMNGNTQRRFEQPDGSYRKLEQAEIADYRAQAQTGIDNYCK